MRLFIKINGLGMVAETEVGGGIGVPSMCHGMRMRLLNLKVCAMGFFFFAESVALQQHLCRVSE